MASVNLEDTRVDYEHNFAKYLLSVNKTTRQTFEEAFSLLYQAWGCGKPYAKLEDFCTEALGWRREDLINLFCEAQMRHFSISSGTKSSAPSPTKVNSQCSPSVRDQCSPFNFNIRPSTPPNIAPCFGEAHLIRSSTVAPLQLYQNPRVGEYSEDSGNVLLSIVNNQGIRKSPSPDFRSIFRTLSESKTKNHQSPFSSGDKSIHGASLKERKDEHSNFHVPIKQEKASESQSAAVSNIGDKSCTSELHSPQGHTNSQLLLESSQVIVPEAHARKSQQSPDLAPKSVGSDAGVGNKEIGVTENVSTECLSKSSCSSEIATVIKDSGDLGHVLESSLQRCIQTASRSVNKESTQSVLQNTSTGESNFENARTSPHINAETMILQNNLECIQGDNITQQEQSPEGQWQENENICQIMKTDDSNTLSYKSNVHIHFRVSKDSSYNKRVTCTDTQNAKSSGPKNQPSLQSKITSSQGTQGGHEENIPEHKLRSSTGISCVTQDNTFDLRSVELETNQQTSDITPATCLIETPVVYAESAMGTSANLVPINTGPCTLKSVSDIRMDAKETAPRNSQISHVKQKTSPKDQTSEVINTQNSSLASDELPGKLKLLEPFPVTDISGEPSELSAIIQEAAHVLSSNPDDPLSTKNQLEIKRCELLYSEPDPNQLPEKVLILMLTEIFPNIPPLVTHLVRRLKHMAYTVCYDDYKFDDELLTAKLEELYSVSSDLISIVVQNCKKVTEKHIKETSSKLRSSKRRLRSAKKNYENHLEWVLKTRDELEEAERELLDAQDKNDKILKDIAYHSNSPASKEEGAQDDDVFDFKNDGCKENDSSSFYTKGGADSGNVSITDNLDDIACDAEVPKRKSSLLSSVMEEIGVIERKKSTATAADEKIKKLLRNTRQSIIMTKKSVRDRLDTNVSAEQESITKEDSVNERQLETNRLGKKLKKFRRAQNAIDEDGNMIKSCMKKYLDTVPTTELDDESFSEGRRCLKIIRNSKHGRLLSGSRKDAMGFAHRARILDVGEWIIRKKYAEQEVQEIYSRLSVKDLDDGVHILDLLKTDDLSPSVIILCGPKGSGKTCMCHFILHQWKLNMYTGHSKVHEFDLVLYATLNNILASGSWSQYLREHVFCVTLNDFSDTDIHESVNTMTVLFLLDVSTFTHNGLAVLEDIFQNLGRNKVVITSRPGCESELVGVVRNNDLSFLQAKLCPMTTEAVNEYSQKLFSKEEMKCKDIKHFTSVIDSMKANDSLLYPLYVTYFVYLWTVDPGCIVHSTSVSRLFTQIIMVSQNLMMKESKQENERGTESVKVMAEKCSHQLCKSAWNIMSQENLPAERVVVVEAGDEFFKEPHIIDSYHPLVVVRESPDEMKQGVLPHYSLAEILCGFYFASKLLFQKKGLIQRKAKIDVYLTPDIQRYRDVFPHMAGALVYNKHSTEDAKEIVTLYSKSLKDEKDVISWVTLLRECDFLSSMCSSVSSVLSQIATWSVASYSGETNCAVADLLRRGAYQPKLVIISNVVPKRATIGCGRGVDCIIRALSTCPSTLVHLRQELQFYTWGEEATCDAQVIPLQPPGTLQDCWGHLGTEGALALRHSHHLEELNVRISSCEALTALSHSLAHLRSSLRYLYLRLDLPTSTPTASLQPLQFKGKKLWLRVRGIRDSSVNWVIEMTKKLSGWYSEIVLEESRLSPLLLHSLKASLPRIPVHVSG